MAKKKAGYSKKAAKAALNFPCKGDRYCRERVDREGALCSFCSDPLCKVVPGCANRRPRGRLYDGNRGPEGTKGHKTRRWKRLWCGQHEIGKPKHAHSKARKPRKERARTLGISGISKGLRRQGERVARQLQGKQLNETYYQSGSSWALSSGKKEKK